MDAFGKLIRDCRDKKGEHTTENIVKAQLRHCRAPALIGRMFDQ